MNKDIFFFEPVLAKRIWGGDFLKKLYGKTDLSYPVGEAWLISGMENNSSKILSSPFQNFRLDKFFATFPEFFSNAKISDFPLLVKLIDAVDKLSVQVHPNDSYALKHENAKGKNECWYVIDATPDSYLITGHNALTKAELKSKIINNDFDSLLRKTPIKKDDFIYIPAGTIHAIGAGVRLVEVQQPSDITYRVYDYSRLDDSGKPRKLSVSEALDVTIVPAPVPKIKNYANSTGIVNLFKTADFQVDKWKTNKAINYYNFRKHVFFFVVLEGEGIVNLHEVKQGDAFMAASTNENINVYGNLSLLTISLPDEALQ